MAKVNKKNRSFVEMFKGIVYAADSSESVESWLSMMPSLPQYVFIRQYVVFHRENIDNALLGKYIPTLDIIPLDSNLPAFEIDVFETASQSAVKGIIVALPSSQPNFSRITTVSYSNFWNRGVSRVVRKMYPQGMPVFFKQDEIENALTSLEQALPDGYRVRIADVTAKAERPSSASSPNRRSLDTERRWTNLSIKNVFISAQEREQWFTGLRFIVQKQKKNSNRYYQVGAGRLSKYGQISFDSHYEEITSILLGKLEEFAFQRLALLDKRGIRERGYKAGKPIEISYSYEAFEKIEEVRRFGKAISSYPNATKAVFHSNPYYHASVADFLDGSSFDVWVLSPTKVVIIPQAKSSVQGFERLISHIFSNFGEGRVNEFQR